MNNFEKTNLDIIMEDDRESSNVRYNTLIHMDNILCMCMFEVFISFRFQSKYNNKLNSYKSISALLKNAYSIPDVIEDKNKQQNLKMKTIPSILNLDDDSIKLFNSISDNMFLRSDVKKHIYEFIENQKEIKLNKKDGEILVSNMDYLVFLLLFIYHDARNFDNINRKEGTYPRFSLKQSCSLNSQKLVLEKILDIFEKYIFENSCWEARLFNIVELSCVDKVFHFFKINFMNKQKNIIMSDSTMQMLCDCCHLKYRDILRLEDFFENEIFYDKEFVKACILSVHPDPFLVLGETLKICTLNYKAQFDINFNQCLDGSKQSVLNYSFKSFLGYCKDKTLEALIQFEKDLGFKILAVVYESINGIKKESFETFKKELHNCVLNLEENTKIENVIEKLINKSLDNMVRHIEKYKLILQKAIAKGKIRSVSLNKLKRFDNIIDKDFKRLRSSIKSFLDCLNVDISTQIYEKIFALLNNLSIDFKDAKYASIIRFEKRKNFIHKYNQEWPNFLREKSNEIEKRCEDYILRYVSSSYNDEFVKIIDEIFETDDLEERSEFLKEVTEALVNIKDLNITEEHLCDFWSEYYYQRDTLKEYVLDPDAKNNEYLKFLMENARETIPKIYKDTK